MFTVETYKGNNEKDYEMVIKQLLALIEDESDQIANLSNASALLNQFLADINWIGFYLAKEGELVLGPFQGLPACVRIPFGKGVCGTSASERKLMRVEDVHEFPGHIACDAASRSEIVIPLIKDDNLIGVLDIDSPSVGRFTELDETMLVKFSEALINYL